MFKFFFIPILSFSFAYADSSKQLIVVMSDELNATTAFMQRYEMKNEWEKIGEKVPVTLGRSGMGYASMKEPMKHEGDGRSPAGLFNLSATFGYDIHPNSAMPYLHADEKLICVDDSEDALYNTVTALEGDSLPKSFERMHRDDELYRNGIVIDYNHEKAKGRGSCIFIHLNHPGHRPTSGCTAMEEGALKELLEWLDPQKNPRILQIPISDCHEYQKEFVGIECK